MTEEQIKQKAILNLDDIEDRGCDLGDWSIEASYVNGAVFGAEIATKELQKENAQLNAKLDFFLTETKDGKEYRLKEEIDKAKELLRECRKYHFHPEVTEYPYNEVEAFLGE